MSRFWFRRRKPDARTRRLFVEQLEGRRLLASFNWDGAPDGGGASADANWRTNTNWNGDRTPVHPVSDIEFPAGAANLSNFNDYFAGATFNSILLSGSGYTLQGNAITMQNGITSTIPAGSSNTVSLPVTLTADQTWTSTTAGSTLDMSGGAIDLRGFNLTVNGSGTTILGPITDSTNAGGNNGIIAEGGTVVLSADNSTAAMFAGIHNATLQVLGSASQTLIDINGGTLTTDAAATTGPINLIGANGGRIAPGGLGTTGILSTQGNLVMNGFGTSLAIDLNGTTAGSGYDALHITGTATLSGFLNLNPSSTSTTGSIYTILTATAGVTNTFIGLNDLDKFTANGRTFQIAYTPNSVVLTDVTVEYVVNDNTDAADANLADGLCDTNLATSGLQCTLRAAMQQANFSADANVIKFNIPGTGVHTISPATALPIITAPVTIDGYTQPGASPNTDPAGFNGNLLIELNGTNAGDADGLSIMAGDSIIRGLVVDHFKNSQAASVVLGDANGVLSDPGHNRVEGNFIGTDPTGHNATDNIAGLFVSRGSPANVIGGTTPAARNIISGNGSVAIFIVDSNATIVQGNFIGTDASGKLAVPNGTAVDLLNSDSGAGANVIGGAAPGAGNVISGNFGFGIEIGFGHLGTIVQGNFIGTDVTGTKALGNGTGIDVDSQAYNNLIGGTAVGAGNVIAFNKFSGAEFFFSGTGNSFLGNSFFANGAAIRLTGAGPTPNDAGDADSGSNNLQNFPVITYATRDAGKLKVTYNVPSAPANSTYPIRVEFFLADATDQGQTYLGFDTFSEDDFTAGGKTATFTTAAPIQVFDKIVATATDSIAANAGGGPANTSEFSPSVTIVSPWQNPGRLRWDVDNSTTVEAADVVTVINYINAKGSGPLPASAANQKPFLDVDGDNNVVAADVVDIINYINAGRPLGGEAEAADAVAGDQTPLASDLMSLLAAEMAAQATKKRK